jgi:1-acyl-sn-glycerol-3-phosphate acyltransferase
VSRVGLAIRLAVMVAVFLVLAPVQALGSRFGMRVVDRIPVAFHRLFLRLFGIRIVVRGRGPEPGVATLVLANHVSWLDIPAMGSLTPLSFIAKSEIAGWPLVGLLARLQRCVFIDRARRGATAEVNAVVGRRLARGDVIVLFPEGTTGDGNRVLPFRSSLVGAARAALADPDGGGAAPGQILLQPLAISYVGRDGLPVTRRERPAIAWYGDMDLGPHLAGFVRGGPLDIVVSWGEPVPFGPATNRKSATAAAETAVRRAVAASSRPLKDLSAAPYSLRTPNTL